MGAARRASRKSRRVSRKRRTTRRRVSRKRRVVRKRRVSRKKRVVKRKKARKPVKKETGSMKSVWEGKAKKTKKGLTKRSLMMKDGKVVAKTSVIGTRLQVFRGTKERTAGGLMKKDLMKNKRGKVISKKAYKKGRALLSSGIGKWAKAVVEARKNLGITGFCAVKKGTKLYKMARQIYDN